MRFNFFTFLLLLGPDVIANSWLDSIYKKSDFFAIGVITKTVFVRQDTSSFIYSSDIMVIQVGRAGSKKAVAISPLPGYALRNIFYVTKDSSQVLLVGDTFMFPLVASGNDSGLQLTTYEYNWYSFRWYNHSGPDAYAHFNLLETYCHESLKLTKDGGICSVLIRPYGKWLYKSEVSTNNKIISATYRYRKPKQKPGPTVTIYKARTYDEEGKLVDSYRRKVKQYGIGTKVCTWTFRKNGKLKLRYGVYHNPFTW